MRTLFAFLLFALTLPAVAAPFALRSEVPISQPVYSAEKDITRSDERIATNGDQYLAVWTDSREGGEPSVYAARMRADGTVIDPLGIRVANGAHAGPVIWTGSKWLLAYQDEPAYRAVVRTMTADGVFGEPIEVGLNARFAQMATNGTNVLLVLSNGGVLLDLEGNKLRDVSLAESYYTGVRVAAAGSNYLVAHAFPQVLIQAVSSDGTVGPQTTLAQTEDFTRVGLASDGERFLVVWPDNALQAQLVTSGGVPTGPVHTLSTANVNFPNVVWRDGEYFLLFSEDERVVHYAMRLAANGSAAGNPAQINLSADGHDVEIAAHGRGGIAIFGQMRAAVFDDASIAGNDVFRRVVDVAVTARMQTDVHLAALGDGYVAAWEENDSVFLSTAAGTAPVAVLGSSDSLIDVLVDRSNVIWVLWGSERWVAVTRFWPNLQAIDLQPVYIHTTGALYDGAAAAGEGVIALAYEVVDDPAEDRESSRDIAALLLWETGTGIARHDVLLSSQQFADFNPVVAFDGSAFVYGWMHAKGSYPDPQFEPQPVVDLVGARVTPDGQLLDASPVIIAENVGNVWQIDAARGTNGVAFAWKSPAGLDAALFGGVRRPLGLGAENHSLGALAPHHGGFLLVRGVSRRTPRLTFVEYFVLGPDLAIQGNGALPQYEADTYWKDFDIDVVGGTTPVFAYVKSANDGRFGHVPRVYVRTTGEAPPRRRPLR